MKSTKYLEAVGAYKKDPQRRRGPEPENPNPLGSPPDHFSKVEVSIWFEMAETAPPGVLTQSERPLIANYCRLEADVRESRADMAVWKAWVPEFKDEERPPAPRIIGPAHYGRLESILSKLGMSPLDRQRVSIPAPKGISDFDDL
jgi:hypothetical protein